MARTSITKEFKFSMGHALWGYDGKCFMLHGHNYTCLVTVSALEGLTDQGFVMDFNNIKDRVAKVVDEQWDHKTLLNQDDDRFDCLTSEHGVLRVPWNPTAENLAASLFVLTQKAVEEDFGVLAEKIILWETDTAYAEVSRR